METLRTTNSIERLNEEFRRRVKTQGALSTEDSALILLFGLVATSQITLRKLDGYISERINNVLATPIAFRADGRPRTGPLLGATSTVEHG